MVAWILWSILGVLILLGIIAIIVAKKCRKKPTDYYAFFIMGISWLPFGILVKFMEPELFLGNLFIMLGAIYLLIGLSHRKEWKKNHKSWKQLKGNERKFKLIILLILGILVFLGLVAFYLTKMGILR